MYSAVAPLIAPSQSPSGFNVMQHWGNLSPYFSVASHGLPDASSLVPGRCTLEEMHWLQRHGARWVRVGTLNFFRLSILRTSDWTEADGRYPTSWGEGPASFAGRLEAASGWKASGNLGFLNDWSYQLGAEVLTPFGRSQMCKRLHTSSPLFDRSSPLTSDDLGVAARLKYGFLLDKMPDRLPVFRTESQE